MAKLPYYRPNKNVTLYKLSSNTNKHKQTFSEPPGSSCLIHRDVKTKIKDPSTVESNKTKLKPMNEGALLLSFLWLHSFADALSHLHIWFDLFASIISRTNFQLFLFKLLYFSLDLWYKLLFFIMLHSFFNSFHKVSNRSWFRSLETTKVGDNKLIIGIESLTTDPLGLSPCDLWS